MGAKMKYFRQLNLYIVQEEGNTGNVKQQLEKVFDAALRATVPNETDVKPLVAACTAKFGDYQWYTVILYNRILMDYV